MKTTRISVSREPWSQHLKLYLVEYDSGTQFAAQPVVMKAFEEGCEIEALTRLPEEAAQSLMDQLYAAGIRPTAQRHDTGVIDAMKDHLGDMRRLVFKEGA